MVSARERRSRTHHFMVTMPSRFVQHGSRSSEWLQKMAAGRLLGRFCAVSHARLREDAERVGVHHLV